MTTISHRFNPKLLAPQSAYKNGQIRNSSGDFFQSNNFEDFRKKMLYSVKGAESTRNLWKKISIFVGIPCIALAAWLVNFYYYFLS